MPPSAPPRTKGQHAADKTSSGGANKTAAVKTVHSDGVLDGGGGASAAETPVGPNEQQPPQKFIRHKKGACGNGQQENVSSANSRHDNGDYLAVSPIHAVPPVKDTSNPQPKENGDYDKTVVNNSKSSASNGAVVNGHEMDKPAHDSPPSGDPRVNGNPEESSDFQSADSSPSGHGRGGQNPPPPAKAAVALTPPADLGSTLTSSTELSEKFL